MSLRENIGEFGGHLNEGIKSSTRQGFLWFLKCVSGALIGLTLALVGQELLSYGTFSLVFVMVTVAGVFCKVAAKWRLASLLIVDLVMVLLALSLRMYILIAPGM